MDCTWHRIQDIVDAALDLPAEQRASYLNQNCPDPRLRRSVESLILSYQEASRFLEEPAIANEIEASAQDDDDDPNSWEGRNLGNYRILAAIGRGGMGMVFRAARDDDQYRKHVAIKLLRAGFRSSFTLARFKSERQILATLEHPNIASLRDAGTTADGVPYFVMELVEGQPIDQFCDARRLGIRQRLQLFQTVCAAVQYAHHNLVIHRDLKPGNILVTSESVPKLLDFGIAKILEPGLSPGEADPTIPFLRMLTPDFASPEQMKGEPISTASDVYSLGVILYMLLSGHRPYRLAGLSTGEMCRLVSETEPAPPSAVVVEPGEALNEHGQTIPLTPESVSSARDTRPDGLRRTLAGDLDNIVLKALNKEPARRYASVEQLSEDIRRYLEDLPVNARPDTLFYRAGKFVRRNKLSAIAVVLLFLSLSGGLTATLWQAHVARIERAKAEKRFNDVRSLANSLVFDVHDSIQNLPGATPARKLIVDRAAHYLDELSRDSGGDLALQHELAVAYTKLGSVQGNEAYSFNLGDTAGARASYSKAINLSEAIVAHDPHNLENRWFLAYSYLLTDSAENHLRAAEICEKLANQSPSNLKFREELARSYRSLGFDLVRHNDLTGALDKYLQALKVFQEVADADPKNGAYREELSSIHKNVAAVLATQKNFREALAHDRAALRLDQDLLADHPDDVRLRYGITFTYSDIGFILGSGGDPQAALASYEKALAIRKELSAADPKEVRIRGGVARTYFYIAMNLSKLGRDEEAVASFRKSLDIREALMAANPTNQNLPVEVAFSKDYLGVRYGRLAAKSRATVSKRIALWRLARSFLQQALPIIQDQENHHTLVGNDIGEPQRIQVEIQKCNSAIARLQRAAGVD